MKRLIIKKIIIYSIAGLALEIIASIYYYSSWTVALRFIVLLAILFDIGRTIEKKHIRKKFIIYSSVFFGEVLLFILLSQILGVGAENTPFAFLTFCVIFITIIVMLHKIAKSMMAAGIDKGLYLYLVVGLLIIILIGNAIAFILTT